MGNALNDLMSQQSSAAILKDNVQSQMAISYAKMDRLQTALNELSQEITALKNHHKSVQNLTVDGSRWRGTRKNKCKQRYETYEDSVKDFLGKAENKKERLKEEIAQANSRIASYESTLASLSSVISSLNSRITAAREE